MTTIPPLIAPRWVGVDRETREPDRRGIDMIDPEHVREIRPVHEMNVDIAGKV